MTDVRHDWTREEIAEIHSLPLTHLVFRAQEIHRRYHVPDAVQLSMLLSIKSGACPEDCAYCPQSARSETHVQSERLMAVDAVLEAAREAKEAGATRFCMGAAWRSPRPGRQFDDVLEMVRGVSRLGMEACATLGMLTEEQAVALKSAGLTWYNHNLDCSPEFYGRIVTTRTYEDRLATLKNVRTAGLSVCCGGIIGMGESIDDRCGLLVSLATLDPHPESIPINALVAVSGTPLGDRPRVDPLELVRMIATTRIVLPRSMVRLSAGRSDLSREAQVLAMLAGANSMFYGDRLLTTGNTSPESDRRLLSDTGVRPLRPDVEFALDPSH